MSLFASLLVVVMFAPMPPSKQAGATPGNGQPGKTTQGTVIPKQGAPGNNNRVATYSDTGARPIRANAEPAAQDRAIGKRDTAHAVASDLERRAGWAALWRDPTTLFNGIVAVFTIVLALSTIALWRATKLLSESAVQQSKDMQDSIAVAQAEAAASQASADAAKAANQLSRELFLASERPWVTADVSIGGPLFYDVNGANITLHFVLRNVGRTPATNVMALPHFFIMQPGKDLLTVHRETCASRANAAADPRNPGFGHMIFPGGTFVQGIKVSVSNDEMDVARAAFAVPVTFINPAIVGCITYSSTSGHHQTGFVFQLSRTRPGQPGRLAIDTKDGDVAEGNLVLSPWFQGTFAT